MLISKAFKKVLLASYKLKKVGEGGRDKKVVVYV